MPVLSAHLIMVPICSVSAGQFISWSHSSLCSEQRFSQWLEGIFCNLWSQPASSRPVGLLLEASAVLHQALALHPDRAALSNWLHGDYSMPLKSHLALPANARLFKPDTALTLPTTSAWATGEGWSLSSDTGWCLTSSQLFALTGFQFCRLQIRSNDIYLPSWGILWARIEKLL